MPFPFRTRDLAVLALIVASTALAQKNPEASAAAPPAPSPEELKRFIDWHYKGGVQTGPALVEIKPCLKVDNAKGSPTFNECLEPVTGPVKRGTQIYAALLFSVPDGGRYDDVVLQWIHEGTVRTSTNLQPLTTSLRTRVLRPHALSHAGKWEIRVLRGKVGGPALSELGSITVTATD